MTEETLFHEVLSKLPCERSAFLDEQCADNAALRAAVEALLAAHEASGSFLDKPANSHELTVDSAPGAANHGATGEFTPEPDKTHNATTDYRPKADASQVIGGRYTLLQRIGEGGMGEVWVAQQTEPVSRYIWPEDRKAAETIPGTMELYDRTTGKVIGTLPKLLGPPEKFVFSPDGRLLAAADNGPYLTASMPDAAYTDPRPGTILIWIRDAKHPFPVARFHKSGRRVVAGSTLWDIETAQKRLTVPSQGRTDFCREQSILASRVELSCDMTLAVRQQDDLLPT